MFDIGFWELVLLFIVVLIVVGPERLPQVARTAGLWVGKARRIMSEVKDEVQRELRVEELKRTLSQQDNALEIRKLAERVKSINTDMKKDLLETRQAVENAPAPKALPAQAPADEPSSTPPVKQG